MAWRAVAICVLYAAQAERAGADAPSALLRERLSRRQAFASSLPRLSLTCADLKKRSLRPLLRLRSSAGQRRVRTSTPGGRFFWAQSQARARVGRACSRARTRTPVHTAPG